MMKLLKLGQDGSRLVPHHRFKKREKGLQGLMERAMPELLDGTDFVESEMILSGMGGRVDSIAITPEGQLVLVEYKERKNKALFEQGLRYVDHAIESPEQFWEHVHHETGRAVNPASPPKLVLVAKAFTNDQLRAINRLNDQQEVVFKVYEVFCDDDHLVLALKNCPLPKDKGKDVDNGLRIIRANNEIETLNPADYRPDEPLTEVMANLENLLNAKAVKTEVFTEYDCLGSGLVLGVNRSIDRLLILEDDSSPDFVRNAMIKWDWACKHHERLQGVLGDEVELNWGYEPQVVLLASQFTPEQILDLDSRVADILPLEYSLFTSESDLEYMFLDSVTLPRAFDINPALQIYGRDDIVKLVDNKFTVNALTSLIGELGDLGDVKINYNRNSVSIQGENVFCNIRPSSDHVNIKIKVGDDFEDKYGLTTGFKDDDGYRRFNIRYKKDVPHAMQLIRKAYHTDKGD